MAKTFKQSQNQQRHKFLLTFFKEDQEIVEINGYVLKKYFNPMMKEWQVAIYTKRSYSNAEYFNQSQSHMQSIRNQSRNS